MIYLIFKLFFILVARASQELMLFMKTHQVNPIKGMILPAVQVIFVDIVPIL